jgi:ABC-2 type transport system permease protein
MYSYVKSEIYRIIRYRATYLFIVICSLLLLSSNIVLAAVKHADKSFPWATTYFSFSNVYSNMAMVYVLCIMVAIMIFGNEHSNHTLKNSVSYGISRGTLFFGKYLVEILYSVFAFVIIIGVHVISGYLLLENSGIDDFNTLIRTCIASFPLLMVGLAVTNCFAFINDGSNGAISAACGIIIVLPLITNLLGMKFDVFAEFGKVLPWNILNSIEFGPVKDTLRMYWDTSAGLRNCYIIGLIQIIIFSFIGYVVFNKKEVK